MKNIKTAVAVFLATVMIILVNPINANAEWKCNSVGWWYTEGNSYATGWRYIGGEWYYFYGSGYMAHDTSINGFYVNSNGEWIQYLSAYDAEMAVKNYLIRNQKYIPSYIKYDYDEGNDYIIHCYDIIYDTLGAHTATSGWYYVDKNTGNIRSMF